MRKTLRYSLLSLLMLVCGFASAQTTVTFDAATDLSAEGSTAGETSITKDGITLAISNGIMGNGQNYRCYKGATFTVTSTVGNITNVELTSTANNTSNYGPGNFVVADGNYSYEGKIGTWTGNASTIEFTAQEGQVRMTQVVVTYNSDPTAVAAPVITGNDVFEGTTTVTITGEEGTTIYYTTDGSFYREVLYGNSCPYTVDFIDLPDNEAASFTIKPHPDGQGMLLTDFVYGAEESDQTIEALPLDTVATPIGRLVVSTNVSDTLAAEKDIYVSRSGLQATARAYAARLSVELNDEKSTVVNLSFQDVCIQRAEDVLNTVIAVYNENWVKDKNQIAVSTSMFINERLGVIEQELGHVDENISSYKSENLLPDVQAAASLYMTQSSETNAQILALNTQLAMARYIRNYLTNATSKNQLLPANSGIENPGIEQQIANYNTTQLRRNDLVANSSEKNPLVVDMDQSLQNMRRAIVSSIDNHIVTLNTQLRTLRQSEQQTTARIAANPTQGKYLLSVERQQKVKEALYLFLLQKREENELSQAFTAYNTRIIMPPTGDMAPTAPVKKKYLMMAFALGLFIPIGIIFVRESLNTKLRGRKDLEALSLPFAGEIPMAFDKKKAKKSGGVHKVRSGESLYTIAKKRNTTVEKLCKLNGISRRTVLRPGQILKYS